MKDNIIFLDLDGTIIDFLDHHYNALQQTYAVFGKYYEINDLKKITCLYTHIKKSNIEFREFWDAYDSFDNRDHGIDKGHVRLFNDTLFFLEKFKDARKVVISDTPHEKGNKELDTWKIKHHFDLIYLWDCNTPCKPHTGRCLEAIKKLKLDAKHIWFIGDMGTDVTCGKNLEKDIGKKVLTIYVNKNNKDKNADYSVNSLREAAKIIEKVNKDK